MPGTAVLWHWTWPHVPDVASVFCNRAVARELTRACHIENGLACPGILIAVQFEQSLVCLQIRLQIGQMHVVVSVCQQYVAKRSEDSRFIAAEVVREDQVQCSTCLRFVIVVPLWVIPASTLNDLLRTEAEQEEVLFASFFSHLDRSAIASADGERSVHHELHIACATRLVTSGRDLVRYFGSRDEPLCQRNVIVR